MFRRERDARRVAKAVREHKETMGAFARASLANAQDYKETYMGRTPFAPKTLSTTNAVTWVHPENVRAGENNPHRKIDAQRKKGLLTQGEAAMEKAEVQISKGKIY